MTYEQKLALEDIIAHSKDDIVFFGGAGVSTESGIPDFRSENGLYNQKWKYKPEFMLSHTFFKNHTTEFFDFYRQIMIPKDVKPNAAHEKLAELEQKGKLSAVVTQNIDGLHQAAGSIVVHELHGSIHRNYCTKCGKQYPIEAITETTGVPHCECGGIIRPDVVLYEESLSQDTMLNAECAISTANVLIVGGTSLSVYPAARLVGAFRGTHLIIMNNDVTAFDSYATMIIRGKIGENLDMLKVR